MVLLPFASSVALLAYSLNRVFAQAPGAVAGAGAAAPNAGLAVSSVSSSATSTPLVNSASLSAANAAASASSSAFLGSVEFEGTWTTKSNSVFTGPDFFDPVSELLIEPALPGISYSFTSDGFFEQALYKVSGNATNHKCPTAILIYQHGTYEMLDNNTLVLTPFAVDGRQLLSDPCNNAKSIYSRFNATIIFQKWQVYVDPYHGRYRLDLYQFDGSPLPPLYMAYKPPMMLPTITMNPTSNSTDHAPAATASNASVRRRIRRSFENRNKTPATLKRTADYTAIWWTGVALIGFGATCLMFV